jgi:valyl-tRNA synthetase
MHIDACDAALTQNVQPATMALAHRWILSRLNKATREVHDSLSGFRFNDTASALYQFIWHEFCDWYLEWIKSDLYGDDASKKTEAQTVLFTVLETVLKLLHPITPFVTEEIWHFLPGHRPTLMTESYPLANPSWDDKEAEESAALIMGVIGGIRNIRSEMQIHPSAEIEAFAICPDATKHKRLQTHASSIMGLTRTAKLDVQTSGTVPQGAASYIFEDMEIFVPLKGLIDVDKEITKLNKNKDKIEKQATQTKAKLSNEKFLSNAPDDIIAKENAKLDEFTLQLSKIDETIARLLSI